MRVIVSAIFKNLNSQILLARRIADGKYTTPGGKVEEEETLRNALFRETDEECGMKIDRFSLMCYREIKNKLIVFYEIHTWRGEPLDLEPHKHANWHWVYPCEVRQYLTEGLAVLQKEGLI